MYILYLMKKQFSVSWIRRKMLMLHQCVRIKCSKLLCSPQESWDTKVLQLFGLLRMQTCHRHILQCTSALWKYRSEADYISVSFEGL